MRVVIGAAAGALLCALALGAPTRAAEPGAERAAAADAGAPAAEFPRVAMREILGVIAFALPRSLDPARFGASEKRAETLDLLRVLARDAEQIEGHGAERGEGFRHLSRQLAADAREVARRYEEGRYDESGFLLQRLTENCLACHSRLYSDRDSPLGRSMVEQMELEGLSSAERARLQAATRQFEAALETWEALFQSPDVSPAQMDVMGWLADYLTVCVRVRGDEQRALETLRRIQARDDVADWLKRDLAAWIRALESLRAPEGGTEPDGSALARARKLIQQAEKLREVPADHTGLVHDLVASSLLYRYTESRPRQGRDVAEAYYWLGVAESRIDRSYWLSQADLYLETAIRMAPAEPFAADALALLRQRTTEGYTGSAGTHVPADVQAKLDELQALVAASR
jgi:tetratricopeptide (TPR) repeat protein